MRCTACYCTLFSCQCEDGPTNELIESDSGIYLLKALDQMQTLSPSQRQVVFSHFCFDCGEEQSISARCRCWDEHTRNR